MSDAYERYLADFGERIEAAVSPPSRARSRWVLAVAVVTGAVLALVAVLAAPSGDRSIDVLAEARAALPASAGDGEMLHVASVSTLSLVDADEATQKLFDEFARTHQREYAPHHFEQWSTDGRWRVASQATTLSPSIFAGGHNYPGYYISDADLREIGLTDEVTGPTQEAYADGIDSFYVEKLDALIRSDVIHDPPIGSPGDQLGSFPGGLYTGSPTGLGSDPVAAIRESLDRGNVRDAGTAELDGRTVRRLVSTAGSPFEYDVDAETFEPVRIRDFSRWPGVPKSQDPPTLAQDVIFDSLETLPLNSDTEALLEIDAPPDATVIDAVGPAEQQRRAGR